MLFNAFHPTEARKRFHGLIVGIHHVPKIMHLQLPLAKTGCHFHSITAWETIAIHFRERNQLETLGFSLIFRLLCESRGFWSGFCHSN
jgi:hypothetical protein